MASVLTVMCCLYKMTSNGIKMEHIALEAVSDMLIMLRLMPQLNPKKCDDWKYLSSVFSNKYFRGTLYLCLRKFILYLSQNRYLRSPEWIYSIALFHLLYEKVNPFQEIELNPEKIPWEDKELELSIVRSKTYDQKDFSG